MTPKYNWFKFWLWFLVGGVAGGFVGIRIWSRSSAAMAHSMRPGLLIIAGAGLAGAIIAGLMSNSGCDEE